MPFVLEGRNIISPTTNGKHGMSHFRLFALAIAYAGIGLTGCGGGDGSPAPPPAVTTQIQSDPSYDGDIAQTTPTSFMVTQGMTASVQSVFVGIDPTTLAEYR